MDQPLEAARVPIHAEVGEVSFDLLAERFVLLLHRLVPVAHAPVGGGRDRPPEPRSLSLHRRSPTPAPSPRPVMGETQEVEGPWPFSVLLPAGRTLERNDPRLVGVQTQAELLETLP